MRFLYLCILLSLLATYILSKQTRYKKPKKDPVIQSTTIKMKKHKHKRLCDRPGEQHHGTKKCTYEFNKKYRIFGGKRAKIENYKFMACLLHLRWSKTTFLGGAAILSRSWAIGGSAYQKKPYTDEMVANDELYIGANSANWKKCDRHHVHIMEDSYDRTIRVNYSLVLFKVFPKFEGINEEKTGLPNRDVAQPYLKNVVMLGWADNSGEVGKHLKYVKTQIIGQYDCMQALGDQYDDFLMRKDWLICTLREGTDACTKDAGGPLYYPEEGQLIGVIVKTGTPCVNYTRRVPDVHLSMEKYSQWVFDTIRKHRKNRLSKKHKPGKKFKFKSNKSHH